MLSTQNLRRLPNKYFYQQIPFQPSCGAPLHREVLIFRAYCFMKKKWGEELEGAHAEEEAPLG